MEGISSGIALVTGSNLVLRPATGSTALGTFISNSIIEVTENQMVWYVSRQTSEPDCTRSPGLRKNHKKLGTVSDHQWWICAKEVSKLHFYKFRGGQQSRFGAGERLRQTYHTFEGWQLFS